MKIAIIGGGIAGLSAGIALARIGAEVSLFERAPRLEAMGAALSIWPNATAALAEIGVLPAVREHAAPFTTMLVADKDNRSIIAARAVEGLALIVTRTHLQQTLAAALPPGVLHLDHEVADLREASDGIELRFASGEEWRGDFVVDAGGIRSVGAEPGHVSYRGYGGVIALSDPVGDRGLDGLAAEYWGWNERFGLFELPDDRRYWFYMRDQASDAWAPSHRLITERAAAFPSAIGRAIAKTPADRLVPFAIHARSVPRSLGKGRILHTGDAAHAMEPNLGQGACQAIEDAVALAAAMRHERVEDILTQYERLRLKRVRHIVQRSAEGRHGAHGPRATQWLTRSFLRLLPAGVSEKLAQSIQTMPDYRS